MSSPYAMNTKVPYDSDYEVLQGLYDELKN